MNICGHDEVLDSSRLVPIFRQRFADRILDLLQWARECKQHGTGVLSIPEIDDGLRQLGDVVKSMDPSRSLPLLENIKAAKWPKGLTAARKRKLRRSIETCARVFAYEAETILRRSEPSLGVFPEPSNWSQDPDSTLRYTPRAYFLNALDRGSSISLQALPVLDRLFGGSADQLLQSLLAFSALEAEFIRLAGHYGYFDGVFTALLVGNTRHLSLWSQCNIGPRALPPPVRRACDILQRWIADAIGTLQESGCTSRTAFDIALHQSFLGLARRNVDLINLGVSGLIATWSRTDLAVWDGRLLPFLNVPAMAILRTAIRNGLSPMIPDDDDIDVEVVEASDPNKHSAPFALYPGIDLMINEPGQEPATLFVNERIASVSA